MGLTVIDAGVLIAFFDAADTHHPPAKAFLDDAHRRGETVRIPHSALVEALVGSVRRGDDALTEALDFVERFPITIVPGDLAIARVAARLRAQHGQRMRLPDALVVATAVALDADVLVTTDRRWPTRAALGLRAEIAVL